jgi:lipopolysaccharide assembly outer membrane protein LptD (OstA)
MTVVAGRVEAANFGGQLPAHFVASDGVTARGRNATVRAARVQRDNGHVLATGGVTMTQEGSTLSGNRLESNDDFKTASLTGNVHARTADGGAITAGILHWQNAAGAKDWERGRILARDGVTLTQRGTKLRGDKLDATANGAAAVMTGNVVVVAADGATLRAPTARYDRKADKIYASGGVSFKDPQQSFRVRALTYDLRTGTVSTEGGSGTVRSDVIKDKKLFKNR